MLRICRWCHHAITLQECPGCWRRQNTWEVAQTIIRVARANGLHDDRILATVRSRHFRPILLQEVRRDGYQIQAKHVAADIQRLLVQ